MEKTIEYNGITYQSRYAMFRAIAAERGVAFNTVRNAFYLDGIKGVDHVGRGMGGAIPTTIGSLTFKSQDDVAKHFKVSDSTVSSLKYRGRLNTLLYAHLPLSERNLQTARDSAKRLMTEIEKDQDDE